MARLCVHRLHITVVTCDLPRPFTQGSSGLPSVCHGSTVAQPVITSWGSHPEFRGTASAPYAVPRSPFHVGWGVSRQATGGGGATAEGGTLSQSSTGV